MYAFEGRGGQGHACECRGVRGTEREGCTLKGELTNFDIVLLNDAPDRLPFTRIAKDLETAVIVFLEAPKAFGAPTF